MKNNIFRNLLWFSRHPADERESEILNHAYQRAMLVLWIGSILTSGILGFLPDDTSPHAYIIAFILEGLVYLSILAGWLTVQNEELEFAPTQIVHTPSTLTFIAVLVGILGLGGAGTWFAPHLLFVIIALASLVIFGMCVYWVWSWMREYTVHARLLAGIIFGPIALGYLMTPNAPLPRRILYALGIGSGILLSILGLAMPIFLFIATPAGYDGHLVPGVTTEKFEQFIINYRDTDVTIGDTILADNLPGLGFGRVTEINEDTLTVEVTDGVSSTHAESGTIISDEINHEAVIHQNDVRATIILDPPLAEWISL